MVTDFDIVEIWLREVLEGLPVDVLVYDTDIDVQLQKTSYVEQRYTRFVPLNIYVAHDDTLFYRLIDISGLMNPQRHTTEVEELNLGDPALMDRLAVKFRNHVEKHVGRN